MLDFIKKWNNPETSRQVLSTLDGLLGGRSRKGQNGGTSKGAEDILVNINELARSQERIFNVVDNDLIDDLAPEYIEFERDYVIIGGDIYASFLYIVDLPTSLSRPMWRQLLNFPGAVYVSMHCDVIPPHEAAVMLRRESNAIFTKQIFRAYNRQRSDVVDSFRTQRVDAARIQTELSGEPLIYLSITIGVMATSREALDNKIKAIKQLLRLLGLQGYTASYQQLEGLVSILPLGINALHHHCRNVSPYALAQMFPNFSEEVVHPRGFVFGKDKLNNTLIIIDPYELTNPNIVIIGKPGAGKSYFMKSLVEQAVMHSTCSYILDIEGEYYPLAKDLGGLYIDMSLMSDNKINILDLDPEDPQAFQEGFQNFAAWVSALLQMEQVNVGSGFSAALGQAYEQAFQKRGIDPNRPETFYFPAPTLSEIVEALEEVKQQNLLTNPQLVYACEGLINVLHNYAYGVLANVFNVESNVRLGTSPLVVFGLRDAGDEKVKRLRILQVQIWIWHKILSNVTRKLVVIDEAWYFMQHELTAKALAQWARRMRKKNASLLIGTQFIDEFEQSPYAGTIFNIAETYLFFRASATAINRIGELGKLTDNERQSLVNLNPGEFLLHSAGFRRLVYNTVPARRHMTYTTKPSDLGF